LFNRLVFVFVDWLIMKKYWFITGTVIVVVIIALLLFKLPFGVVTNYSIPKNKGAWGITYSKKFATSLNLDWQQTYTAILDDLGTKKIRLPLYWDDIEAQQAVYNFSDYDWMINEGNKKKVEFIIVIGRRVPRWPECHTPNWVGARDDLETRRALLKYLKTTVERYQNNSNIIAWQVENEPLLDSFGVCPQSDYAFLRQEVELVKSLDTRPIMLTASGELSDWRRETTLGDWFGATVYRTVWSPTLGYIRYPWPSQLYIAKAASVRLKPEQRILAELQAEPWAPNSSLNKLPKSEATKSFNLDNFKSNILYAEATEFNRIYLWGVEWWYMQKEQGDASYWDMAKQLPW